MLLAMADVRAVLVALAARLARLRSAAALAGAVATAPRPLASDKPAGSRGHVAGWSSTCVCMCMGLLRLHWPPELVLTFGAIMFAAAGATDLRAEAEHGLRVFAPLANRLGVWSLKAELEDLCFLVSARPDRCFAAAELVWWDPISCRKLS